MVKVICNHAGGKECNRCKHNEPHLEAKYITGMKCTQYGNTCTCASDDMTINKVQCYPI